MSTLPLDQPNPPSLAPEAHMKALAARIQARRFRPFQDGVPLLLQTSRSDCCAGGPSKRMGGQAYSYGRADQALHHAGFAQTVKPESVRKA
jgi:hypothetical protein